MNDVGCEDDEDGKESNDAEEDCGYDGGDAKEKVVGDGKLAFGVIQNIPKELKSADLRRIFEHQIEHVGIDCFHYRHRPQKKKGEEESKTRCMCIVRMTKKALTQFINDYDNEPWFEDLFWNPYEDISDEFKIKILRLPERMSKSVDKLPELNPPNVMPNGNVGTPLATFQSLIRQCKLPSAMYKKLNLNFAKYRSRKYGRVPFRYRLGRIDHTRLRLKDIPRVHGRSKHFETILKELAKNAPKTTAAASAIYESTLGDEDGEQENKYDEEEEEEWDRHLGLHPQIESKNHKERLFEKKVSNPWDKGDASALVHYTDAFYWDQHGGDFDERTADDWDVDFSAHYGLSSRGDRSAELLEEMRRFGHKAATPHSTGRHHFVEGRERGEDSSSSTSGFEAHTRGMGSKLMREMGWQRGETLGSRGEGLDKPIEHGGKTSRKEKRYGIGFRGDDHQPRPYMTACATRNNQNAT
eukprot:m.5982 g.5982  ORF g.5982 m.5982 type:complete len:469 (+) comp2525_c0_seq1:74-1480(+)